MEASNSGLVRVCIVSLALMLYEVNTFIIEAIRRRVHFSYIAFSHFHLTLVFSVLNHRCKILK